ncbi:Putative amidase [Septoria linicola]|uniref:Amidase n=1 Tax=Septoria linicola TaxID=215465 RepID=A0A9Q9EGR1_9PEZI|nr:putative amidase [Septoria linicola]USW49097.1 Putative amidase [Septoria linicola]
MSTSTQGVHINKPQVHETTIPWHAPADPANPVVKGLPLHLGAILISKLGFVQQALWNNAGFASLRDRPELQAFEPRYEPVVTKSNGAASAASEGEYLKSFAKEDWKNRRPSSSPHWSVLDYHAAYVSGKLTPSAVVKALLPLIDRDAEKPHRHSTAYLQVRQDLVLAAAKESTRRYAAGKFLSVIDGVPLAIKDEMDLSGYKKWFGSKIEYTRKDDATSYCVQKWQDAGGIIVGKTNMHEFGADTTNNNPWYGTPLNPNNEKFYCGGSSGGSAYSVAAGLTPICEGNDGGGSIRLPANYCGLYGLKPSQGRISGRPSTNLAKSNGVAGPLAANMVDLEVGYRIMAQPDPLDTTSSLFQAPSSPSQTRNKVLGIYAPWFDRADPLVKSTCQASIDHLVAIHNYTVVPITLPLLPEGQLAHAMTILAELATGVPEADQHKLTPANKVLLSVARKTTAVDLLQAQRLRNLLMQHLAYLYEQHPGLIIVTPTTPNCGWRIGAGELSYGMTDGNKQIRNMEYVWLANFTGCPAITAPVGYEDDPDGKVPIGLMGMADWCEEDSLIAFGYDLEKCVSEAYEGGRVRPKHWTDVLDLAARVGGEEVVVG